ncbi:MAG: crossover junction endodeoxyribonuclease RuvC [Thermoanaerobaculaceae bacterium]|nr:crossover junction endodeoxyribonuclease RuvC [Thermoanaerobaculaceae bacterium]
MTGWGLLEGTPRTVTSVEFGRFLPRRNLSRPAALASLTEQLEQLLARLAPDVVVIETPFTGRFPKAALALAETRGALLVALGRWGGRVVEIEPARMKAAVVGHGRAEKQQVAYVIRHALKLSKEPPADAADALALALCHVRSVLP